MKIQQEDRYRLRIEPHDGMRVPGIAFITGDLLPDPAMDESLHQVARVASLPGIVGASFAMPDLHSGYGFPIGGVAGTDITAGGVVSPGGAGSDIGCGIRLMASDLLRDALEGRMQRLMNHLDRVIPRGLSRETIWRLPGLTQLEEVLVAGPWYAVERGYGTVRDLQHCEDRGGMPGAERDVAALGAHAIRRGLGQLGSLGSGHHFVEIQAVDQIFDQGAAHAFGLRQDQVCVMIHSGSRGLGHQVATDHVRIMQRAMHRYRVTVTDPQLACVPVD